MQGEEPGKKSEDEEGLLRDDGDNPIPAAAPCRGERLQEKADQQESSELCEVKYY